MKMINKTILMLFALVLCLSMTVGATVAYFSDYEQASGGATLHLGGKTELYEGDKTNEKNIVVTNTGETDMIVRVGIYGPDEMEAPEVTGKWNYCRADGMYYYGEVLPPGKDTSDSKLRASLEFEWEGDEPDYYLEVTVVHEGSQAIYEGKKLKVPNGWDKGAVAKIKLPASQ